MNNLDKKYQDLLKDIIKNGTRKSNRTGIDTISVFGRVIRHNMSEGFPLLTTKKMYFHGIVTELLWFLRGETNIKSLIEDGNYIWVGDAYKYFIQKHPEYNIEVEGEKHTFRRLSKEEFIDKIISDDGFAKQWGEMGPIYGKQWRNWEKYNKIGQHYSSKTKKIEESAIVGRESIDQIQELIDKLKSNPDDRRMMVSAWNVAEIGEMKLPPCHYGFQVWTRDLTLKERRTLITQEMFNEIYNGGGPESLSHSEIDQWDVSKKVISLLANIRSSDVPLGLPFNIASYGLLLVMLGGEVNMIPDELIINTGDTHIYVNQLGGIKEQLTRKPYELPTVKVQNGIHCSSINDIILKNYKSHPAIKIPLSN